MPICRISVLPLFTTKGVCFKAYCFLIDNGSKVEEVQDSQTNANQLPEPEVNIHLDEITVGPSEAPGLRR